MVLPFPFDQVESFFRDFFRDIYDGLLSLPSRIINGISGAFASLRGFVSSGIDGLKDFVMSGLRWLKDTVIAGVSGIPATISNVVNDILRGITSTVQNAFSQLSAGLGSLTGWITRQLNVAAAGIQSALGGVADGLSRIISNVSAEVFRLNNAFVSGFILIGQNVNAAISNGFSSVNGVVRIVNDNVSAVGQGVSTLAAGLQGLAQGLPGQILQSLEALWTPLSNSLIGAYNEYVKPLLNSFHDMFRLPSSFVHPTGSITPEEARQQLNLAGPLVLAGRSAIVGGGVLAEALSLGQMDQAVRSINDVLGDTGITEYARDFIMRDYVVGVRPALDREILARFEPMIPGAGDLVRMVVKEAFVPELVTPAPDVFAGFLRQTGFTREWADRFWTAHWTPLPLNTALDMFYRGIITRDDLIRRLVILDFRPDDAVKLQQLFERLPNRVETRIMSRFGLLSEEQINEILRAEGIREDFVEPLRVMMQEFNLTSIFTKIETASVSAFEDGLISEGELVDNLRKIRRPAGVIAQDVELSKLKRMWSFKRDQIAIITRTLKRGVITREQAMSELRQIGLDTEVVGMILALATYELDIETPAGVKAKTTDLSVSQVQQALKKGLIDVSQAMSALSARGYDSIEQQILIGLALPAQ